MRASVIVITRDRSEVLCGCLETLRTEVTPGDQVIVVDSSIGDATDHLVGRNYPWVNFIRIPAEQGSMPRQRNVGIRHATGDIACFTDDDCLVQTGWLGEFMRVYMDERVGGVGGRMLIPDNIGGHGKPEETRLGGYLDTDRFEVKANFHYPAEGLLAVDWLVGCNMSFRREVLCQVGGFDERLVGDFSWEEVDLCMRVRRAGFKLLYNPKAQVHHLLSPRPRVSRQGDQVRYYWKQNRMYFSLKYFGFRRVLWQLLVKEPYWALHSVGWRLALTHDLWPRMLGILAYVHYNLESKRYPLVGRPDQALSKRILRENG